LTRPVRSPREAASFVDRVGIALVFPRDGIPLPSLWEAVAGDQPVEWVIEKEDGTKDFSPEMERVWSWKDELPAQKRACAGKHLRGWATLVSLKVLPSLYALTGLPAREDGFRQTELSSLEREVAEAVLVLGPLSSPELRQAIGCEDTARVNRALDLLQRKLVLTKAGTVTQGQGWPAGTYDVLARRYKLGRLPDEEVARLDIARIINAPDAPTLARTTGWNKREAARIFGALA